MTKKKKIRNDPEYPRVFLSDLNPDREPMGSNSSASSRSSKIRSFIDWSTFETTIPRRKEFNLKITETYLSWDSLFCWCCRSSHEVFQEGDPISLYNGKDNEPRSQEPQRHPSRTSSTYRGLATAPTINNHKRESISPTAVSFFFTGTEIFRCSFRNTTAAILCQLYFRVM